MVTKKDLQELEMSLHEYFEYIVEQKANGQHELAKVLFSMMSEDQQEQFFEYVDVTFFYEVDNDEFTSEMINFRDYFNTNNL
jgi:hypothetical protein